MTTTPAYHRLQAALKAGDMLNPETEGALDHLQAAESAMLEIGMLLASCTDRPREVLNYIADTFTGYGWGIRPERPRPGAAGERDESGAGPAERWLFEATGDQPLIWASMNDVAGAQETGDTFHPRKDEES